MSRARALMFQGTGSDVGKSVLVAGLCRAAIRRGIKAAPFKPQNMSNNAAVTAEGGEIGRAQYLQALAARMTPSVHMNPVLLKPETDKGAQVIVQGQAQGRLEARAFHGRRDSLMGPVLESFGKLSDSADLILVEGAGSAAEVNLRAGDIANMGFALETGTPVALIGDIDRGGVIASLVGSYELLSPAERGLVRGYIINKFRGDVSLFDGGLEAITGHSGWRSFGVVPWLAAMRRLPAEDAVVLEKAAREKGRRFKIAVPMLSRIANFDDVDPLRAEPDIEVVMVPPGPPLPRDADLILLPGTKATLADMDFLEVQGWDIDIQAHVRQGRPVLGLCGGYQLMGRALDDPEGIEGPPRRRKGLGLLNVGTEMRPAKQVRQVRGRSMDGAHFFEGYEIHIGETGGPDCVRPFLEVAGAPHGAVSADGLAMGAYVHGLFAADGFRRHFLERLGHLTAGAVNYTQGVDRALDEIAQALEEVLDIDALFDAAR